VTLLERQRRHVLSVEPHHVEHVVNNAAGSPRDLAVENRVLHFQAPDGLGHLRNVLRQPVAREEPHVRSLLERDEADAVELSLEDPFRAGETLLRERRGHRLEPIRKLHD
jgi:hypothetical protein